MSNRRKEPRTLKPRKPHRCNGVFCPCRRNPRPTRHMIRRGGCINGHVFKLPAPRKIGRK